MRDQMGKLITVWVPGLHGGGGTTVTSAVGIGLKHYSDKKILIINKSGNWSYLERFIEDDIKIKYTLDDLKVFNTGLEVEHIFTYATQIKDNLYMLAASKIDNKVSKVDDNFEDIFLNKCLEGFDIVIADVSTGIREDNNKYLEHADIILCVYPPNEIMLDDLYNNSNVNIKYLLNNKKTLHIFNKMFDGWDILSELRKLNKRYNIENSYGLVFDGNIFEACCRRKKFYSYFTNELESCSSLFTYEISLICHYILATFNFLEIESTNKPSLVSRVLSRFNKNRGVSIE